jgi:hypothetical protein
MDKSSASAGRANSAPLDEPPLPRAEEKAQSLSGVLKQELTLIATRRDRVGVPADDVGSNLVGLALSGGGIRSASFNLGLLQALYRRGILRQVDYLSTVSGGGYIGAWLSDQGTALKEKETAYDGQLPLKDLPDGRQSGPVARLIRAGQYLNNTLVLANRYLIGLLKTNLVFASILLLVCVILALLWRLLDQPPVCESILVLTGGVLVEAVRPFMVPMILFLVWLIGWTLSAPHRGDFPVWLSYAILAVLCLVTFGLPILEWFYGATWLLPDYLWWRLLRPVPLLLTVSWVLASCITSPHSAASPFSRRRYVAGLVASIVVVLAWLGAEPALGDNYFGDWRYFIETCFRVIVVPCVLFYAIAGGLWWLLTIPKGANRRVWVSKNLRWVLLLAGATTLVAGAVWFATPSINFRPLTSTDLPVANKGTIEVHNSWLAPILGVIVTSLLPFLRPQRLLESGLNPKSFWEPWVFRIACLTAVTGIPLIGIHLFARHNVSGWQGVRDPELVPWELDWKNFWSRVEYEKAHNENPGKFVIDKLPQIETLVHDQELTRILTQQPVPVSPAARRKRQQVIEQLNSVVFNNDPQDFADLACGELLKKQKDLHRSGQEKSAEAWAEWPRIEQLRADVNEGDTVLDPKSITALNARARAKSLKLINRLILEAHYGGKIWSMNTVVRPVVVLKDQWFRLGCVAGLVVVSLLAVRFVRINVTSLHWYYRDQLAAAFLGPNSDQAGTERQSIRLSHVDTVSHGLPYHLISATLNTHTLPELALHSVSGVTYRAADGQSQLDSPANQNGERIPRGPAADQHETWTDAFLFSPAFCGSSYTGFCATETYEKGSNVRLSDAVALSGAAVSLSQINNPLILLLMVVLNLRLGQWLPSPRRPDHGEPPSLWNLSRDTGTVEDRKHFFISDGGHYENLGLEALLNRRCKVIIVSDATWDPEYAFADLRRVSRRLRRLQGITIGDVSIDLRTDATSALDLVRPKKVAEGAGKDGPKDGAVPKGEKPLSPRHYFVVKVGYPASNSDSPGETGYIVYLKPSITGDEAYDLLGYWREHSDFPHDPTANQFYDENMVESYRQLGEHMGEQLFRGLAFDPNCDHLNEDGILLTLVERLFDSKATTSKRQKKMARK